MQELASKKMKSEVITVMFVDMVGYTKKTAQMSRNQFTDLLNVFDNLSLPVLQKYDGRVIKKIGDAFLVVFQSPTDAILCGIELQKTFHRYSEQRRLRIPLQIRVAVHTGEVIHRQNDVYGDAVNAAARIEGIAKAGQVVFSEPVFSVMNKNEVPFTHLGLHRLKGLKYPIRLFRVMTYQDVVNRRWAAIKRFIKKIIALGIVATLVYFLIRYLWTSTNIFLPFL